MNKKFKFLTVLLALVMTIGVFAPLGAVKAAGEEHKTDVVIHKMELKDLTGWPKDAGVEGADKTKYDGTKLGLGYFGDGAKELANVKFTYWKVSEADYKVLDADHKTYDNVDDVEKYLKEEFNKAHKDEDPKPEYVSNAKTVTTTADGATIEGLVDGYYWFVEDKDSVSRDGRTFAGAAAVPFGLTLPYAKADGKPFGTGDDALHVYPKNKLADKPVIDKDFKGKANPTQPRSADEKNNPEPHNVGDIIEYEVQTVFQPNTQYKTAFWTDQMTDGLSFNQDSVEVKVGEEILVKGTDYTVDATVNTFKVVLTDKGLEKVNNKTKTTTVTISYNATLTEKAVKDIPESNDVVFHYGNNPSEGNTPVPNSPKDKKMTVTKDWAEGTAPEGVTAKVTLYDANTGEKIGETQVLSKENNWAYTWEGLDDSKKYKVVEEGIDGYDAEYKKGEAGSLTITNHKTNNPKPLNPDEPKVVTRDIKFVKMEKDTDVRLEGAKFIIKNKDGKYLQESHTITEEFKSAYEEAQKEYENAVAAFNALPADNQTEEERAKVQQKAQARDLAWKNYLDNYTIWGEKDTAKVFTSNEKGQFEVKGLEDGTYSLVEIEAPKGYAKIENPIEFTIGAKEPTAMNINYEPDDKDVKDALRVDNTKITIPQTGGIGTVIFTVVGVMLMVGAAFALKRRKEDELEGLA